MSPHLYALCKGGGGKVGLVPEVRVRSLDANLGLLTSAGWPNLSFLSYSEGCPALVPPVFGGTGRGFSVFGDDLTAPPSRKEREKRRGASPLPQAPHFLFLCRRRQHSVQPQIRCGCAVMVGPSARQYQAEPSACDLLISESLRGFR